MGQCHQAKATKKPSNKPKKCQNATAATKQQITSNKGVKSKGGIGEGTKSGESGQTKMRKPPQEPNPKGGPKNAENETNSKSENMEGTKWRGEGGHYVQHTCNN